MGKSILVVDDDRLIRSLISTVLKEDGHCVEEAESGKRGLSKFQAMDFDLVLTDLRMPDISGLDLIREGRRLRPESRWIIITAYGSIGNAVAAMKVGASDYLTKPFDSPEELRHVVRRVLREAEQEQKLSLFPSGSPQHQHSLMPPGLDRPGASAHQSDDRCARSQPWCRPRADHHRLLSMRTQEQQ